MITVGRRYRYTARRGKLTRKRGQIITVLCVHKWQIRVRFPDGIESHVDPRFLENINPPLHP